jgi:hypothetical protein
VPSAAQPKRDFNRLVDDESLQDLSVANERLIALDERSGEGGWLPPIR